MLLGLGSYLAELHWHSLHVLEKALSLKHVIDIVIIVGVHLLHGETLSRDRFLPPELL